MEEVDEEEKKAPAKSNKKAKKAKDEDEELEQDDEEIMIDTSIKANANNKKGRKSEILPKVGEKRLRQSKNKDDDEEGGDDDKPAKKRKVGAGKEKVVKEKKKPAPKRPKEFKKGRWNPDIELVDHDKYKDDPTDNLNLDCCIRCNNKNIIRAVLTENERLLKKGIEATKTISNLCAYWSPECQWTSMEHIVSRNLHSFLELMMHPKVKIPAHSTYQSERDNLIN